MSTPPGMRARPAARAADTDLREQAPDARARRPPLAQRLPGMADDRLVSLQRAATRISQDPEHSRHASATAALPLIDAEIGRRAASLEGAAISAPDRK